MLKMIEAATPSELRLKVGCQTDLERILINFTHHFEQNTNGLTYEDIELNEEKKRLAAGDSEKYRWST